MISSLRGKILGKGKGYVEVEVRGVGYRIRCGGRLWRDCREGERVKLWTHMAVSDKEIALYGFNDGREVEMFEMLVGVPGVGPKTAIQILGESKTEEVVEAIRSADVEFFCRVKGVGKKAGQKIIVELKNKMGGEGELDLAAGEVIKDDLYLSLKNLGFSGEEIRGVTRRLPADLDEVEEKLAWCLRRLG